MGLVHLLKQMVRVTLVSGKKTSKPAMGLKSGLMEANFRDNSKIQKNKALVLMYGPRKNFLILENGLMTKETGLVFIIGSKKTKNILVNGLMISNMVSV
jgi:hypothetical protein